ncbi:MAG: hypothetical protein ACR2HG_00735 [Pyrinomonadaceae bacterium]
MGMPVQPTKPDWGNKEAVAKYQDEMADYRMAFQARMQDRSEQSSMESNVSKSKHDAMMIIAGNMKT